MKENPLVDVQVTAANFSPVASKSTVKRRQATGYMPNFFSTHSYLFLVEHQTVSVQTILAQQAIFWLRHFLSNLGIHVSQLVVKRISTNRLIVLP
jgi:hypothetical protein